MNASQITANRIASDVLNALQAADEIGGPDRPEYASMMENLARVCMLRAATARVNAPEQEVLRWAQREIHKGCFIEQTGGGCTALQIPVYGSTSGDYWWITDDLSAPESLRCGDEPFCMCLYRGGQDAGEQWVGFTVRGMEQARDLIQSFTGVQW